jgi:hypothetical protein
MKYTPKSRVSLCLDSESKRVPRVSTAFRERGAVAGSPQSHRPLNRSNEGESATAEPLRCTLFRVAPPRQRKRVQLGPAEDSIEAILAAERRAPCGQRAAHGTSDSSADSESEAAGKVRSMVRR